MRPVSRPYVSNFTAAITYDRDDKRIGPRTTFNLTGIKRVHYSERLNYHSQHFQSCMDIPFLIIYSSSNINLKHSV